jgi:hypothetical protein
VAVAAGAFVMAGRKKRAAQQPEQDMRVDEAQPQEEVPYEPTVETRPQPAAAPVAAATGPAPIGEANASEAIGKTEKILADAENVGLDTSKARQLLKIARNMQGMGKHTKAVEFCKKAEDSIE